MMRKSKEIDKYIKSLPVECRDLLAKVRDDIFDILADESEMSEVYSYKIAVYKYGKKPLFSIAGFKDHCSLITQDKEIAEKIAELKNYKISGTSVHFTPEKPLGKDLLVKIIKERLKSRKAGC